jgi:hypothetical protein
VAVSAVGDSELLEDAVHVGSTVRSVMTRAVALEALVGPSATPVDDEQSIGKGCRALAGGGLGVGPGRDVRTEGPHLLDLPARGTGGREQLRPGSSRTSGIGEALAKSPAVAQTQVSRDPASGREPTDVPCLASRSSL